MTTVTKNYIERMADRILTSGITAARFADSYVEYSGSPVSTFHGAENLSGKVVTGLADGAVITPFTMPASGIFTLPLAASNVNIGIGYNCDLQTLPLDIGGENTIQ